MKLRFKCPLCQSRACTRLFSAKDRMFELPGTFTLVKCLNCSAVSLSPLLSHVQVSPYYPPQKYYAYDTRGAKSFLAKLRTYLIRGQNHPTILSRILTMILPKVPAIPDTLPGGKILDVGCGAGDTLVLLKELGWETFGIDIDANALRTAKKRGVDHIRVGFCQDISSYPDNYFDAIRLYHVVEHLDDPTQCMRIIKKKLKRGGSLIVGTPNVDSLVSRIFGTYWYNLDAPRHLVLFSPKTLIRTVVLSGFSSPHIEFCSAGGLLGSIQYVLREKFDMRQSLIHTQWLVMLFYPIEWITDKMRIGDVFVLRATK